MSDTRSLLSRISDLRQRLTQAQKQLPDNMAGHSVAGTVDLAERLEHEVLAGGRVQSLLDGSLRQITGGLSGEDAVRPTQMTARARKLLERGKDLVAKLRPLADDPILPAEDTDDPLVRGVRMTAAMTESAVRFVQAFPESPSAQLRLCEGLEGLMSGVTERIGALTAAADQRRQDTSRVDTLAHLLAGLHAGATLALEPFTALAEDIVADARQGAPLRFLDAGACRHGDSTWHIRHTAAHGLTTAQVVARIVRHECEFTAQPVGPVLAALLHDIGMLSLSAELLATAGPLTDAQRRELERHPQDGADLVARRLPSAAGLADGIAQHHERLDGTGYPAGRRLTQIGSLARLLAVADVYAAQCCGRPHRKSIDPRTALTDTLLLGERDGLDRNWAEKLLHLSFYPVGSVVELTDGSIGRVVATHPLRADLHTPARPVITLLTDGRGDWLATPQTLDLAACEGRAVVKTLPAAERRRRLGLRYPEWA